MKASSVLASVFLSSLAAAAPLKQRDYLTKTELVVETVVLFTTIWDDEVPAATQAVANPTSAGLFYEQPTPNAPASQQQQYTQAPAAPPSSAYTPPAVSTPAYTPPAVSTPAYTPPAVSSAPASSVVVQQPTSAQASQPAQTGGSSSGGGGTGQYSGDITIYDSEGDLGACGSPVYSSDMSVALSEATFGASTYDYMTGKATNKWCGQRIKIFYGDKSIEATITDKCPGCKGADIDLTMAAWTKLTGLTEKTRKQATWSPIS